MENYNDGSSDNEEVQESTINLTEQELKRKMKKKEKSKAKRKEKWYKPKQNTWIYVKNLPPTTNEQEFMEYFSKCGIIRKDLKTDELKMKLYRNEDGKLKGDGLVSYVREESSMSAVELLNDSEYSPGYRIIVERAKFQQKGQYVARDSLQISDLDRFREKTELKRHLGWFEEDQELGLKIVVLKNMFKPIDFIEDENLWDDLNCDIKEDFQNACGTIVKYEIFKDHPEGIVKIKFETVGAAEKAVKLFNNEYYNTNLISCFYWDGKTDYSHTAEDILNEEKRLAEFGSWLENN